MLTAAPPALVAVDEVNQNGTQAVLDQMSAGENDYGLVIPAGSDNGLGNRGNLSGALGGQVEIRGQEFGRGDQVLQFDLITALADGVAVDLAGIENAVSAFVVHGHIQWSLS